MPGHYKIRHSYDTRSPAMNGPMASASISTPMPSPMVNSPLPSSMAHSPMAHSPMAHSPMAHSPMMHSPMPSPMPSPMVNTPMMRSPMMNGQAMNSPMMRNAVVNYDEPTAPSPSPAHEGYNLRRPAVRMCYTECEQGSPMSTISTISDHPMQTTCSDAVQTEQQENDEEKDDEKLVLPEDVWEKLQNLHKTLIQATHKMKRDSINQEVQNFYKKHLLNKLPSEQDKGEQTSALTAENREKQKLLVMETLKDSLKRGRMTKMQELDVDEFVNLEQTKTALVNIKSRLEYHQKQAIFYAVQSGKILSKIKEMCVAENRNFGEMLNEWDIKWSVSHRNFLIDLYYFAKLYPRIVNVSVSLFYFKANFNKVKSIVYSSADEKKFWRDLEESRSEEQEQQAQGPSVIV